jgi:hypothetical protein
MNRARFLSISFLSNICRTVQSEKYQTKLNADTFVSLTRDSIMAAANIILLLRILMVDQDSDIFLREIGTPQYATR